MSNTYHYKSPAALGLKDLDMLAATNTTYDSGVINGSGSFAFQAILDITVAGGSPVSGVAALTLLQLGPDESTVIATVPLVTGIPTYTDGDQVICVFGGGNTASVATASPHVGTLGTDADKVKVIGPFKLRVTVSTKASGGVTHTASLRLLAERS